MSREFGKAVAVIALVAGGLYAYTRWRPQDPTPQGTASVAPATATEASTVIEGLAAAQASTDDPPEAEPDTRPVIATVYECTGTEGRILSDKPCADEARARQVRAPNGMVPTKAEPRQQPSEGESAGADTGSGLSLSVVIPPLQNCEQLDKNEALANKRLRENPSAESEKNLRQLLSGYAATRKEWNCGRAR